MKGLSRRARQERQRQRTAEVAEQVLAAAWSRRDTANEVVVRLSARFIEGLGLLPASDPLMQRLAALLAEAHVVLDDAEDHLAEVQALALRHGFDHAFAAEVERLDHSSTTTTSGAPCADIDHQEDHHH